MGTTFCKRSKHAEVPCSPGCPGPRRGDVREGPVDLVQGLPWEEVLREGEHPQVQHLECQQEDGGGTQRWGSRVDDGDVSSGLTGPRRSSPRGCWDTRLLRTLTASPGSTSTTPPPATLTSGRRVR